MKRVMQRTAGIWLVVVVFCIDDFAHAKTVALVVCGVAIAGVVVGGGVSFARNRRRGTDEEQKVPGRCRSLGGSFNAR